MARRPLDPDDVRMSFGEHLEELRTRLIHSLLGVAIASILTFYYAGDIVAWLVKPLAHALRNAGLPAQVVAPKVTTGFTVYMKVGLIAGLIVAGPWVLYQLWLFIAAGLYAAERRIVVILAPFSAFMTVLGVCFLYYILMPLALNFLITFSTAYPAPEATGATFVDQISQAINSVMGAPTRPGHRNPATMAATQTQPATQPVRVPLLEKDPETPVEGGVYLKVPENELRTVIGGEMRIFALTTPTVINPLIDIDEYIDFVMWMGLAIVIAFQVPGFMMIVGWTGLIDPRSIARYRKYIIIACVVLAAVLTPTGDPFNLMLLAVPLWALFEFGLILMRVVFKRGVEEDNDSEGSEGGAA